MGHPALTYSTINLVFLETFSFYVSMNTATFSSKKQILFSCYHKKSKKLILGPQSTLKNCLAHLSTTFNVT